jgi:hypothetical protein
MGIPLQMSAPLIKLATNPANLSRGNFRPKYRPSYMTWGGAEVRAKENPFEPQQRKTASKAKAPIVGAFTIGLNSGFGKKQKFKPEVVQKRVIKSFPDGGSAVLQLGWYKSEPEVSMRVSIENSEGLPEKEFIGRFQEAINGLAEGLRQNEVWYEFYKGGKVFGSPMTLKHVEARS